MIKMGLCLAAMVLTFTLPSALFADNPDWEAFDDADITGVTVSAAPDGLDYVLSLSGAPTLTVGGDTYEVTWCQGFFLLDPTGDETILATGSDNGAWTWGTKPPGSQPHAVVGWEAPIDPSDRISLGGSRTFTLTSFDAPEGVMYGYHLGYRMSDGGTGYATVTDHFKDTPVPEPGSLVVAATVLAGMGAFIRRRRLPT